MARGSFGREGKKCPGVDQAPETIDPANPSNSASRLPAGELDRVQRPISVDRRVGSADLAPVLKALGCPVKVLELGYGDVSFTGRGPNESEIATCIEIKTIYDLVGSMESGRLSGHQLPLMLASKARVVVLVEGFWRAGRSGVLEVGRWRRRGNFSGFVWSDLPRQRQVMYSAVVNYLATMSIRAGVEVARTTDRLETAHWVAQRWRWWNSKPYEAHRSHLATPPEAMMDHGLMRPVSDSWRQTFAIAAVLPGLGSVRARALADYFKCPAALVAAPRAIIADVTFKTNGAGKPMRIGEAAAERAWSALHMGSIK